MVLFSVVDDALIHSASRVLFMRDDIRRRQRSLLPNRFALLAAGAALGTLLSSQAQAQEQSSDQLPEIVVTAQKRTENLQDVPISVSAFSADELKATGIDSVRELFQLSPGLQFNDLAGLGQVYLRGVGTPATGPGIENPVALYVDGVYRGDQAGASVDLGNVASVEVLSGPQGTLFGRNATGGLIQVFTKDPSHTFAGDIRAGYGNYDTVVGDFYVTGGLASNLAANLAVQIRQQGDGYGTNLYNGKSVDYDNYQNVSSKLLFDFTDNFSLKLSGDYSHETTTYSSETVPGTIHQGGPRPAMGLHDVYTADGSYTHLERYGGAATFTYKMDWATLTNITAWRKSTYEHADGNSPPGPYAFALYFLEPHTQASEELQLSSAPGQSVIWTAGVYLFHEVSEWTPATPWSSSCGPYAIPTGPDCNDWIPTSKGDLNVWIHNVTKSAAFYAQASKEIFDNTNLTLGGRVTYEQRIFDNSIDFFGQPYGYLNVDSSTFYPGGPPFHGTLSYTKPTWRIAVDHKFNETAMVYLSYNRGFKSGGFTSPTLSAVPLQPEILDAFELGLKTELFDRHLRLNSSVYDYEYKNIQVNSYVGGFPSYVNAARARLYGLDVSASAIVTPSFTISANLNLEHTEFLEFPNAPAYTPNPDFPYGNIALGPNGSGIDASGNELPRAPKVSGNISATYTVPVGSGELQLTGQFSYDGGWYSDPENRVRQDAYGLVNLTADWRSQGGFGVKLWVKNLTDKGYAAYILSDTGGDSIAYSPPRTFGIELSQEF